VRWYEDVHVGEVLDTGGVPGAARWQRVYPPVASPAGVATPPGNAATTIASTTGSDGSAAATAPFDEPSARLEESLSNKVHAGGQDDSSGGERNGLLPYPYLTLYAFPSLQFRFTKVFLGLDGQTNPKGDLYDRIFSRAEFATRFCAVEYDSTGLKVDARPTTYLAVLSFVSQMSGDALGKCITAALNDKGIHAVEKVQVYRTRGSTVLSEFNRREGFQGLMALIGLNREVPWDHLYDAIQGAISPVKVEEWGVFKKGREYGSWSLNKT
jgi:hypothetical protein